MSDAGAPCKRSASEPHRAGFLAAASPSGAAIRTTIAAVGAMALAFAMHVEVPALAVVFVLARGSAGVITMVCGALAGSACGLVLLDLFDQSRIAFSVALLVLTTIGTYGALGRRFPYGWVQALLSLLMLVGQAVDTPDSAERHAFFDLADVLIAAGCAFVAGASPPSAVPAQLQDALAMRLRALAGLVDRGPAATDAAVLALDRGARRSRALLATAWPTRLASRARGRALAVAVVLTDRLNDDMLVRLASARLISSRTREQTSPNGLATDLADVAALVAPRHGAIDETRAASMARARAVARRIRRRERAQERSTAAVATRRARRLAARLALLSPFLLPGTWATPRLAADSVHAWRPPTLDRYRLRHAVKSGVSYLLVLWAWVASEWGAIVPALVVAVLVSTLATPVGATLRKAVLRVGGVVVGGLAGLLVAVVLLPFITELPAICGIAAAFLLAFLWVQQHSERLTFAALQAAIAFVLTLVHGTAPSPTWRDPLESLIGLAFGIVVVVGMMHAAWPIDATTSAHATLADLLDLSGRRISADFRSTRPDPARHRREVSAARAAREHAIGFVHEVELYGTQFGRPAEDLAHLARAVLELDALAALAETLAAPDVRDAADRSRDVFAAAVRADCAFLAACVRALPGERERCDESDLVAPDCVPRIIVADATTAHGPLWPLVAEILRDLARMLADGTGPARRHAA